MHEGDAQQRNDGMVNSNLSTKKCQQVLSFLEGFHDVFSLAEGERGETNLVEMEIDTGDSVPKKQAARQMLFAVWHDMALHLQKMLEQNVIRPSNSPWASPVVRKNGSLRFCVDYRSLNSVTKPDRFPLPRIDDMLDQLGEMKYFSTLDLASGYWQVRMSRMSREKTAVVTQHGLFEFRVMPFGLMNAPAVFQCLMQQVIGILNPLEGPSFVSVYIDDLLVYSKTLEEHLQHLSRVMNRLREFNLKLQPAKCHFFRAYLYGHNVTVITDHSAVKAVLDKPGLNGKHVRWWLKIFSSGIGHVRIVHRPRHEMLELTPSLAAL